MVGWLTTLLATLTGASGADSTAFKNARVDEFEKMTADVQAVVLDVRTPSEYKAGHIKGAVNVDYYSADFEQKVAALDKSKTYLVLCAGGVRSVKACNKLAGLKFDKLVNLSGGFMAWQGAGKPVEK